MNPKLIRAFLVLFSFIFLANGSSTNDTPGPFKKKQQDSTDIIYLERIYATNTMMPTEKYSVLNIFDKDTNTIWQTPVGSGSGEGIMLRFSKPVLIGGISFNSKNIESHTVYCDGVIYSDRKKGTESKNINTSLRSLYIKFNDISAEATSKSLEKDSTNDAEYYKKNIRHTYYKTDISISVSELELFDPSGKALIISAPKAVPCTITSSSILQPELSYSPYLLADGTESFAWAENAEGNGENEWVEFKFSKNVNITKIKIWNGYQRSESHFINNSRAASIMITAEGVDTQFVFQLKDTLAPLEMDISRVLQSNSIKLTIHSSKQGKKYKDLVISEILFFDDKTPLFPLTQFEDIKINDSKGIASSCFQKILDRKICVEKHTYYSNPNDDDETLSSIELIIRSNKSFVFYENRMNTSAPYDSSKTSTIAEGGWELISASDNLTKIRIFGKHYVTGSKQELYKGKRLINKTNIFQDFLTITAKKVEGDRFIKSYELLWEK